ncbi:MAG: cysteine ABC transporter substrate-binding protein [Deltaproteobacteria bacterium]|jgi:polar amino acid transport system substrate-binding protein|nr:cysteine ABC transporter substrate-binding protein [Deltaproteobacteria bacterium]
MNKLFIIFLWTFALGLAILLTPGNSFAAGELDAIKAAGKIRIAVFSDKPPFGYVDEKGVNQGYDIYLAHRIAQDLLGDPNKVEFVLIEAASRIEVVVANKADLVLANFTLTPERAEQVNFAKPYMKVFLGVVSPEKAPITDVSQLKGKTLIVNKGTTADAYFTKNHPEVELLKYDQNTEAFNAFLDGRGVGLSHDNTLIFAWARNNPGYVVGIDHLGDEDVIAPAVKKGNDELLAWVNEEIIKLTDEGFFEKDYDATLLPAYGDSVNRNTVIISPEELKKK